MFSLAWIIELFAVVVICVSVVGLYWFILRIIVNRRRWDDDIPVLPLEELVKRHAREKGSPTDDATFRHGK